jgi:hypothetical protein
MPRVWRAKPSSRQAQPVGSPVLVGKVSNFALTLRRRQVFVARRGGLPAFGGGGPLLYDEPRPKVSLVRTYRAQPATSHSNPATSRRREALSVSDTLDPEFSDGANLAPRPKFIPRLRPDRRLPRGRATPCPLIIPGCLPLPSLRSGRLHRPSPLFDPGCLRRPSPLLDCENQPFGFSAPMWKCCANTLHAIPPARADEDRFAVTRLLKARRRAYESPPRRFLDPPRRDSRAPFHRGRALAGDGARRRLGRKSLSLCTGG